MTAGTSRSRPPRLFDGPGRVPARGAPTRHPRAVRTRDLGSLRPPVGPRGRAEAPPHRSRTGQPAATDVVQATVLAGTAREAEAFAKTAVILGTAAGLAYLDRIGALGAMVLTSGADVLPFQRRLLAGSLSTPISNPARPPRPGGAGPGTGASTREYGWPVGASSSSASVRARGDGTRRGPVARRGGSRAPGRLPWYGTRLFAFLACFATAGSVVYGLLLTTKLLDAIAHRPVTFALHKDLALVGLGLAGVHALAADAGRHRPFLPRGPPRAVPARTGRYGSASGEVAFYLALIVVAASTFAAGSVSARGGSSTT